jgi:hypothetical protein
MDRKELAFELVRLAKSLTAAKTLMDYIDDDDLIDDLETAMGRHFRGSSDVNNDEILFYEEHTKKGIPVNITLYVNPRNQPKPRRPGDIKVGLTIHNSLGAGFSDSDYDEWLDSQDDQGFVDYAMGVGETLEDGVWEFGHTETVRSVANTMAGAINKVLKRW